MRRTAVYFGLWTALCMLIAIVTMITIINLLFGSTLHTLRRALSNIPESWPFCVLAGIVAGVGWWLLHRRGSEPGWRGYALFALAVVLVNHVLIVSILQMMWNPDGYAFRPAELALEFVFHGWLTVPMALIGTFLFVRWNRRREAQ